jgi:hypothetical protein
VVAAALRPGVRVAVALPVHGAPMLACLLLTMTHSAHELAAEMAGCQVRSRTNALR